jgi:antitoxin ParD1/3/4
MLLANFYHPPYPPSMSKMNISLPDVLKSSADEQVVLWPYKTASDYVRESIRRDKDRSQLRSFLEAGASSSPMLTVGPLYFNELRSRVLRTSRPGVHRWP